MVYYLILRYMETKTVFRKLLENERNKLIPMLIIVCGCIFTLYSGYWIFKTFAYKTDELVFDGKTVLTLQYPYKYENFYNTHLHQKSKNIWLQGPASSDWKCWGNNGFFKATAWSEKSAIFSTTIDEYMDKKRKWSLDSELLVPLEKIIDGKTYYSYSKSSPEGVYLSSELVGFFDTYIVIFDYQVKGYCMTENYNLADDIRSMLDSIKHAPGI